MSDSFENDSPNPLATILRAGIGLAPVAYAGMKVYGQMQSNVSINPLAAARGGGSGSMNKVFEPVGRVLRESSRNNQQELIQIADAVSKELLDGDLLNKIFQSQEEILAVTQNLLDVASDPAIGFDQNALDSYKDRLLTLSQEAVDLASGNDPGKVKDAQELISSLVRAVNDSGSGNVRARFASNLRQYESLKPHLAPVPPSINFASGQSLASSVMQASDLKGAARDRYGRLTKMFDERSIELVNFRTLGADQVYARVYSSPDVASRRFQVLVPLDLNKDLTDKYGFSIVRTGEFGGTVSSAPSSYINVSRSVNRGGIDPTANTVLNPNRLSRVGLEDYQMNQLRFVVKDQRIPSTKTFRAARSQFYEPLNKVYTTGEVPAEYSQLMEHQLKQRRFQHSYEMLFNFGSGTTKEDAFALVRNMATQTPGFDPGGLKGDRYVGRTERFTPAAKMGNLYGMVGRADQSLLAEMRTIGEANRDYFPVISRVEQAVGREDIFLGTSQPMQMGRGGILTAGPTARLTDGSKSVRLQAGQNLEFSSAVTGASNKAVLLDVTEQIPGLAGSGVIYHAGQERMRSMYTKPLLEPEMHKMGAMGKLFMEKVVNRAKVGERVRLSKKQIKEFGGFLGFGPQGAQFLKDDPNMIETFVDFVVTEPRKGQRQINLIVETDKAMRNFKGFSPLVKGTFQDVGEASLAEMASSVGLTAERRAAMNIPLEHLGIADAGMLSKGFGMLDYQLVSGFELATGISRQAVSRTAEAMKSGGFRTGRVGSSGIGRTQIGRTIASTAAGLATEFRAGNVDAKTVAMVLKGAYEFRSQYKFERLGLSASEMADYGFFAEGGEDAYKARFESLIKPMFGEGAGSVVEALRSQNTFALAATSVAPGALSPGGYGRGRGSLEKSGRSAYAMATRLKMGGLNTDEISTVLSSIYQSKVGYTGQLQALESLTEMAQSVTGSAGLNFERKMVERGIPRIGLDELTDLSTIRTSEDLFRQFKDGFVLDLTTAARHSEATRTMASAAQAQFGQGQIYFPGEVLTQSLKGTTMKVAGSGEAIEGRYGSLVMNFLDDLAGIKTSPSRAAEEAETVMNKFREDFAGLYSTVADQILGGKIRGSAYQYGGVYDLTSVERALAGDASAMAKAFGAGAIGDLERGRAALNIFQRTHGRAVFQQTSGFLAQLNDFMGSQVGTKSRAADMAQMFFMGSESVLAGAGGKNIHGIATLFSRSPVIGLGNVGAAQIFRDVKEVGRGEEDILFTTMRRSAEGAELLKEFGVSSIADIAKMSAKDRNQFFKKFVGALPTFADEGGGMTFMPTYMKEIGLPGMGKAMSVDMGMASAAIGDFDGDYYMTMLFNREAGGKIMSTMTDKQKRDAFLTAENVYKIRSQAYTEAIKTGIQSHIGESGYESAYRQAMDIQKEAAAKAPGALDIQLRKLRNSVLQMQTDTMADIDRVSEASTLVKLLQEHPILKGKKLPVYKDFGGSLTSAVEALEAGAAEDFKSIIKRDIFGIGSGKESALVSGGAVPIPAQDLGFLGTTGQDYSISLDAALDTIIEAHGRAKFGANLDVEAPSARRLAMMLTDKNAVTAQASMDAILAGQGGWASLMTGYSADTAQKVVSGVQDTFNKVATASASMSSRSLGVVGMAIAGTGVLGAAMMGGGHAPEPLTMPGEYVPPRVRDSIKTSSMFGPRATGPSPEQMSAAPNHYAMMDAPVNIPASYVPGGSSYSIAGTIPSATGMSNLNNYMSTLNSGGIGGSIRINDNRRPITQNYLDRLAGEY